MKMKKKNWDACGDSSEMKATIGFHKDTDGLTFTKDQWEYFKETIDWIFDCLED